MQEDETQKIPLQRALKWAPTWYSWPFTSRSLSQWVSRSFSCHHNAHNNSYGNGWCNAHKNHLEVVILIGQKYQNDIFISQLKYSRLLWLLLWSLLWWSRFRGANTLCWGGRDLVVKGHHIHVRAHFQRGHPFSMYTNRGRGGLAHWVCSNNPEQP